MSDQRQEFLAFALDLAHVAEPEIMDRFRTVGVTRKADGSEVTEADRAAETVMRRRIEAQYPDHGILGEEHGATRMETARYGWVLDPVDGTAGFTLGVPLFGTLVALLEDGEPVVGVMHFPGIHETVYAARGLGCYFRAGEAPPQRVQVQPVDTLAEAAASATDVRSSDIWTREGDVAYRLSALIRQAGKFRFVTDCLQHALVCRGRLHVAADLVMQPWDIAALVPCVEEAGGVVTTLSGAREGIVYGGSLLSTSSPALHRAALEVLQP